MLSSEDDLLHDEASPETIYRRLAHQHADSVYELAMLLVGDAIRANQVVAGAFRRTWTTLSQGRLVGDPVETVYWSAIREALGQVRRGRLRGHLPATTADDRQITAFGIVQNFTPQQQAAIFLAARTGLGYKRTGLASGLGESRVRDITFAARQEYRDAREGADGATSQCHQAAPILSARVDDAGEPPSSDLDSHINTCRVCSRTAALFTEFSEVLQAVRIPPPTESPEDVALAQLESRGARQPVGFGRLLRVAAAPFFVTVALIAGLFVLRQFAEPEVATGVGRTSDLLFARDTSTAATVVVDAGSGRTLTRLPAGFVAPSGHRLYSTATACQPACSTSLKIVDPATGSEAAVGRVDGNLDLVGVDERLGRWYLTDAGNNNSVLLTFDAAVGEVVNRTSGPDGVLAPFSAPRSAMFPNGSTLVTLGADAESGQAALLRTELASMEVKAPIMLSGAPEEFAPLLVRSAPARVLAYHLASGTLHEIDLGRAAVTRTVQLEGLPSLEASDGEAGGAALALGPDGTIFALAGGGGIVALAPDTLAVTRRLGQDRSGQYPTYTSLSASTDGIRLYLAESPRRSDRETTAAYVIADVADGRQLVRRPNVGAIALVQVNAGE